MTVGGIIFITRSHLFRFVCVYFCVLHAGVDTLERGRKRDRRGDNNSNCFVCTHAVIASHSGNVCIAFCYIINNNMIVWRVTQKKQTHTEHMSLQIVSRFVCIVDMDKWHISSVKCTTRGEIFARHASREWSTSSIIIIIVKHIVKLNNANSNQKHKSTTQFMSCRWYDVFD